MDVLYKNCCGLDVHKKTIKACIITGKDKEILEFGTMTEDILSLVDWIKEKQCECVTMESTSVYWKPIYNLLELEEIPTMVVNAQHIKNVPGRKTDVKDSEWIANLLKHGLLKSSFIPSRDQRELRELVRYRRSIIQERTREFARIEKVLEGANIKLASVVSSILTKSGREMLNAIVNGVENPEALAQLAKGSLRNKIPQLEKSLKGLLGNHQKMIIQSQLQHIEFLEQQIENLSKEIEDRLGEQIKFIELIDTIPGVGKRSAEHVLAEIGTDMSRFPSEGHICSWAGLAPGCNESAGKKKSSKTTKGNEFLRTTLVECAKAAAHTKDTYLSSQYHRIAARRGANRASVAVAHTILVIIYHIIKSEKPYYELGADYFTKSNEKAILKRTEKTLKAIGYSIVKNEDASA
jgi:transposase